LIERTNMDARDRESVRARRKALMLTITMVFVFLLMAGYASEVMSVENAGKSSPAQTDYQRLEGRWVRPDGGYILELKSIRKDGSLSAAYYNPRPIKVYRAEWSRKKGRVNLVVELRDVNYPGSIYTLQYDPETDQLKGNYFQAVEQLTFSIHFVRAR